MGVLDHCLRMPDRSLVPPLAWTEICRRPCLQSHLQTSPQPLRSHTWSFGILGQLLKIPPFVRPNIASSGCRGGPRIFWGGWNPHITYEPEERKRERKKKTKMPFIVATYVSASSQGQHTYSAGTKMPFIVATYVSASSQEQRKHSAQTNWPFSLKSLLSSHAHMCLKLQGDILVQRTHKRCSMLELLTNWSIKQILFSQLILANHGLCIAEIFCSELFWYSS